MINRWIPWHRLPVSLSLLNLDAFRYWLRERNLLDAEPRRAPPKSRPVPPPIGEQARLYRSFDGRDNDLSDPQMGAVGSVFGRNMEPTLDPASFDDPNPVTVSQQLLYRHSFIPAETLNVLAAAWIQFQVHDWVAHERLKLGVRDVVVPLPDGAPGWANTREVRWSARCASPATLGATAAWNKSPTCASATMSPTGGTGLRSTAPAPPRQPRPRRAQAAPGERLPPDGPQRLPR